MRLALIGLFGYGAKLRDALTRLEDVELAYGYHPDLMRARTWSAQKGVNELPVILSDPHVEAVLIASPTYRHAEHLLACLGTGKSIFVEKPLVSTYAECEQVVHAYETHPVPVLMVGHNFRRSGWARVIKRMIDEGRLGRLVDIEANVSHGGAYNFRMTNWRGHRQWHREGPMNSLGVHLIDLLHYWVGPIKSVSASIRNLAGVTEAPDASAALMEFETGATALVKTNYIVPSEKRFVVTGAEGTVAWERDELSVRIGRDIDRVPSRPEHLACETIDTVREELQEFCHAVVNPAQGVETDLAGGVAAVCVLEACYRSAIEQRQVSMKEFPLYVACRQTPGSTIMSFVCSGTGK